MMISLHVLPGKLSEHDLTPFHYEIAILPV